MARYTVGAWHICAEQCKEDDFYLLQRKYGRGIYSHDTALYLLGYSDRTPCEIYDDFS